MQQCVKSVFSTATTASLLKSCQSCKSCLIQAMTLNAQVLLDTSDDSQLLPDASQLRQSLPPSSPNQDCIPAQAHATSTASVALAHDLLDATDHVFVSITCCASRIDASSSKIVHHVGRHVTFRDEVPQEPVCCHRLHVESIQANQSCFHPVGHCRPVGRWYPTIVFFAQIFKVNEILEHAKSHTSMWAI